MQPLNFQTADLNELKCFIARMKDLEGKLAPYETLNRKLRTERKNRGGTDDYDVLGYLDFYLNQFRSLPTEIATRTEYVQRHLRLRMEALARAEEERRLQEEVKREARKKQRREEEARQRSANDVRHGFGSLNSRWVGGPDLGSGGYGTARLWLKVDERGRIADVSGIASVDQGFFLRG